MERIGQSVFIKNLVLHESAFRFYKNVYREKGYTRLRKVLKTRWYSRSEQDAVIHALHEDEQVDNQPNSDTV